MHAELSATSCHQQPPLSPRKSRSPRSPVSPSKRPQASSLLKRVSRGACAYGTLGSTLQRLSRIAARFALPEQHCYMLCSAQVTLQHAVAETSGCTAASSAVAQAQAAKGRIQHPWSTVSSTQLDVCPVLCPTSWPWLTPRVPLPCCAPQPPLAEIPQFYYPSGEPLPSDVKACFCTKVDALFAPHPDGMNLEQFSRVVQEVCGLPTIVAHPWFERLTAASAASTSGAANGAGAAPAGAAAAAAGPTAAKLVTKDAFVEWWTARGLVNAPPARRLWEVLRREGCECLTYEDFRPLLHAVLQYHPGLEFLADTPEFQARYAETVIYRIFYSINRSGAQAGCGRRM